MRHAEKNEVNNLKVTIRFEALVELSNGQRLLGTIPQSGGYNTPQLALGFMPVILVSDYAFAAYIKERNKLFQHWVAYRSES